jgi:Tol biopolymer transport system component
MTNELPNLGASATGIEDRVVISPDGASAVFSGKISGGVSRLFLADLASDAVTPLTDHVGEQTASDTFPMWKNGQEVVFSALVGGGDSVYVIDAATTPPGAGTLVVPSAQEPWYGTRP